MTADPAVPVVAERPAVAALAGAVTGVGGRLGELLDEAVDHLDAVLTARPPQSVAAVAVPDAVFRTLSGAAPPAGLLACGAATYLASDVLDDLMDGDPPAFWRARSPGEIALGAQVLLQVANAAAGRAGGPGTSATLRGIHLDLVMACVEGQLRTEEPLSGSTRAVDVADVVAARSGSMLGGLAAMAAVAAGADDEDVGTARELGSVLGCARQHVNDLAELWGGRTADLRNRTATLATAFALERLPVERRQELTERLVLAATDAGERRRVLPELTGAAADVCVLVRLQLAQAQELSRVLGRRGHGSAALDRLVQFTGHDVRRHDVR